MDWTTPLRSQQADFYQRLQLNQLLTLQIPGLFGECKRYSASEVAAWGVSSDGWVQFLAKDTLKVYLDRFVVEVQEDRGVDFHLTYYAHLSLRIKTAAFHSPREKVEWWITPEERDRNVAIVFILHPPNLQDLDKYPLILAGFLPTFLLKGDNLKKAWDIQHLLYGGGLRSYLESLHNIQPQKIDLEDTASLNNWLPDLQPQDLQQASEATWKQEFIQWVQTLALNDSTEALRLYLYDLLNTQYYRQTLWQLYYKRVQAIAKLTEPQQIQDAIAQHDAKAERVMLELAGVSPANPQDSLAAKLSISS
ncbi:MAG: hypothetical protein ACLFV6_08755 [Spirulinaceae cyanobacterium]